MSIRRWTERNIRLLTRGEILDEIRAAEARTQTPPALLRDFTHQEIVAYLHALYTIEEECNTH